MLILHKLFLSRKYLLSNFSYRFTELFLIYNRSCDANSYRLRLSLGSSYQLSIISHSNRILRCLISCNQYSFIVPTQMNTSHSLAFSTISTQNYRLDDSSWFRICKRLSIVYHLQINFCYRL